MNISSYQARVIVFLFLLTATTSLQAQKLSGTIVDATSSETLPFVNVFFNNTAYHALTDSAGRFSFAQTPVGEQTLVVRVVGYKIHTQKIQTSGKERVTLAIRLISDSNQLAEVKITTKKDKEWLRQLSVFQQQFLGNGMATKFCKILNPWVLDFAGQNGTLTAQAGDVLEIDNQHLGYKISYLLNQFSYDGTAVSYAGYAEFSPYFTTDSLLNARWTANRRNSYWYSDTHFFTTLKDHKTTTNHYEAFTDKPGEDRNKRSQYFYQDQLKKLTVNNLDSLTRLEKQNAVYQLRVPGRLEIHHQNLDGESSLYKDKPVDVAWIETNGRPIRFNNEGLVLNPQDCVFSGYLVKRRVADMLPLDYREDQPYWPLRQQTNPLQNDRTERANWPESSTPTNAQKPLFAVERGIDVSGRLTKPRLKDAGNVTLLSPTQQLTFFSEVDKQGVFRFSNLPLEGLQTVLLKFTDVKGRTISGAEVTLNSPESPDLIPTLSKAINVSQLPTDTTLTGSTREGLELNEVIVKAQKPPKPIASLYKSADYTVQGKDLFDKAVGMNFLVALQGRVPGINIVQILDETGFPKLVITMRGGSTTGGFMKGTLPQPLVLVDGVPFNNINQLQSLPASQVERVEVVNRAESLLGLRGYVGIISIITKNAEALSPTETSHPDFVRKTIRGY